MKIGVITYWVSKDNYGEILQCYAMCEYLKGIGHDPFLIRYDNSVDEQHNPLRNRIKRLFRAYKVLSPKWRERRRLQQKSEVPRQVVDRGFGSFIEANIPVSDRVYKSYKELRANPPEADMYIAGSDQIWNFPTENLSYVGDLVRAFMLDFGPRNAKRVAGAASWGRREIPVSWQRYLRKYLKRFDAITVREANGVDLCKLCGVEANLVADPTLHVSSEVYRGLYKNNVQLSEDIRKPYVMVYWAYNGQLPPMEKIHEWANKKDLETVLVTANGLVTEEEQEYPSIEGWLSLIDNASYIITNSFHGAAFSTIFGKKYGVLQIKGANAGMNGRLDSLFEITGIQKRYVDYDLSDIDQLEEYFSFNGVEDSYLIGEYVHD